MTILLENPPQFRWQTDMDNLLPAIRQQVEELNWVISNLQCWHLKDFVPTVADWEKQQENSYIVIPGKILYDVMVNQGIQIVWGVFCGIAGEVPELSFDEIPYADGNRELWTEPESLQLAAAALEIVCFDSSVTIVKFRNEELGCQFLDAFPDGQVLRTTAVE
ncbi:hypothetical protein [Hymenobacter metallilatus]|uniref:Uncharacterized protein n=1 Tax=Hymenobacter metallilatus TaxID=2493666 RepID=A0A428JQ32_9BACT|nr:hypothetical protein [Hymenobacter metallilatus]RSK35477.1 hypothetical protein EI290_07205 [Hymenobacter metallilatus]